MRFRLQKYGYAIGRASLSGVTVHSPSLVVNGMGKAHSKAHSRLAFLRFYGLCDCLSV